MFVEVSADPLLDDFEVKVLLFTLLVNGRNELTLFSSRLSFVSFFALVLNFLTFFFAVFFAFGAPTGFTGVKSAAKRAGELAFFSVNPKSLIFG
jgi:hypothetical protein